MRSRVKQKSLREILRSAWIILCGFSFILSLVAFLLVSYVDYKKWIDQKSQELISQSITIERRISSELLSERTSVAESVIQDLTTQYSLSEIRLEKESSCSSAVCLNTSSNSIIVGRTLTEPTKTQRFVIIESRIDSFRESLRLKYFLVFFLPILGLFLIGIWYQRRLLNRNLVVPIQSLVGKSFRGEEVPTDWPKEIIELSGKLEMAFRERDHAMIGQMASGVLHDIKTLLHGMSVSVELANEAKNDQEKFITKLEGLLKACSVQIPKMKAVIESVLDGNRNIVVHPKKSNIESTIQSVLESSSEFATRSGVTVEALVNSFSFSHDPVQLQRALLNIVKNGIEAIEPKSAKKIVQISSKFENSTVLISVEDSGIGLSSDPSHIFKRIKTTKSHGTGLGFLISKKIVEAHEGTIVASRSVALGGARFLISIPICSADRGVRI